MVLQRRRFLQLGALLGSVSAISGHPRSAYPQSARTAQAESPVKVIRTPILEIGYEEHGPADGFPVVLSHGFPYDVRSFDGVAPVLGAAGFRVLVPYLRGYGPTRFLDPATPRMAQQAAIANDLVEFCKAMGLASVALAGFDWGNRANCIASITNPELVRAMVAIGGYSVQNTLDPGGPGSAAQEARLWYQWYFNTERGRLGLESNRHDIIRYLWETWSPEWEYSDEDYQKSAPSFENPDFVDIVIHSYRHRHANAPGEAAFEDLELRLALQPPVQVPAIVLRGADSGFGRPPADPSGDQARFTNLVDRLIVPGAGHDLPVQRPDTVIEALTRLLA